MDTIELEGNDLEGTLDFLGVKQFRVTYPAQQPGAKFWQRFTDWIADFRCVDVKGDPESGVQEDWEQRFFGSLPYLPIRGLPLLHAASCVLQVDAYNRMGLSRFFSPGCRYKHSLGVHVVEKLVIDEAENGPAFQVHFSFSPTRAGEESGLIRARFTASGKLLEVYEIHPTGKGSCCVLKGPLGAVRELEMDSTREASLHAHHCAQAEGGAILRVYRQDGTLESERPIPPTYPGHAPPTNGTWGWF